MVEERCEYYKEEEIEISLFETKLKYRCVLEDEDCIFDGDEKVCPYRLGIFY